MNTYDPISTATSTKAEYHSKYQLLDLIESPQNLRQIPRDQLPLLVDELRREIIEIVSITGGHLGAGLGVVELTTALHYVFDTPKDKLIWDVSHQCYPHKALTGRRSQMRRIRKGQGPSGFTSRKESEYDPFGAAHSSTAISAGLGFATARDQNGEDYEVISIVGDGAITGGMAFEGLNNVGALKKKQIIILNDNNMSIAPPAGALASYLGELRNNMPSKRCRTHAIEAGQVLSYAGETTLFDNLGVQYCGPFDGHDIDELIDVFTAVRDKNTGPVIIHVITEKGRGYKPAQESGDKYHGVSKFDIATGKQIKPKPSAPSYTSVFADSLIAQAKTDETILAVTAAMPSGTGLNKFAEVFPDRCFDVGISEQHAVTFCGGMACEGMKPFAAIYSTFLQRAYDQIVHDIAIQRLPVRFAIDRAGMVGADGVTHQGSYDITYLGCLPDFVLMAAADEAELVHMVATAVEIDDRPSAFRYPRGEGTGCPLPANGEPLEIGRGRIVCEGTSIALLSYGASLTTAVRSAEELKKYGFSVTVADARFAKPIDDRLVRQLVNEHETVITIEEGAIGGFSAQVVDSIRRQHLEDSVHKLIPLYLPDRFIDHDSGEKQLESAALDTRSIVLTALNALNTKMEPQKSENLVSLSFAHHQKV